MNLIRKAARIAAPLIAAAAVLFGGIAPVEAAATVTSATSCTAAQTGYSGVRVCVDPTVSGSSGNLYVYANGGDTWTSRSYIGNLSTFIVPGWVATGGDVSVGADVSFTANGQRIVFDPVTGWTTQLGAVRFCVYGDAGCSNTGYTVLATGSYATSTVNAAKTALTAGAPFYLVN